MAIYSVGRKRVILALLLTSALLLTLDLRGNPGIDAVRSGFGVVLDPVESATAVVTNPIERVWHGITNYDDLEQENIALQEQVDRLIGTQAAAEAAVIEGKELQALYSLPSLSGIDTEVARVIGPSASNLDQVIEINKGSTSGIAIGMPVVNQAGLVGKVTNVSATSARVMLVTDARYTVAVKVTSSDQAALDVPDNTTPSGLAESDVAAAGEAPDTLPPAVVPGATLPNGLPVPDTTLPGANDLGALADLSVDELAEVAALADEAELAAEAEALLDAAATTSDPATSEPATPAPTTTLVPAPVIEKEYGALEGRGATRLPQIRFIQNNPALAELRVGDLVETAGGSASNAPTGIPVGRVANRADRAGSGGPLLDVELNADLGRLNFVRVVLYKPLAEVGQ